MRTPTHVLKAGPRVDRSCYTDDSILEQEQLRIFERAWLFVAHASELERPGDFRTTDLAGQPVLAVKGDDGRIRVFLNTCRHHAAVVEEEEQGCRQRFRCMYHHWEYDNQGRLVFVPRLEGYGPDFRAEDLPLVQVARVEAFHGLVFASFDADAPPLADYLGAAAPYLEEVATYSGRPQKALGSFEYTYSGNWKLLYENSLDDYHAEFLHYRVFTTAPGYQYGKDYLGQKIRDAAPTAKTDSAKDGGSRTNVSLGIHGLLEWHVPPEQMEFQKSRTHRVNLGIFPSIVAVYHPSMDATGLRIIKPISAGETRVLNYCLGPADLSPAEQKAAAERFHYAWGPGGRIMMDDVRALNVVQRGLRAKAGGDILITRGMHRAGPRGTVADEHAIRGFWSAWRRYMLDAPQSPQGGPA
jgi:phenylpropionate dioxygenase-like ring-hydroxylating dioxygenase large terminal subunit